MDIRSAKKGTTPQRAATAPGGGAGTLTPKSEGDYPESPLSDIETYDGNITVQQYMGFLKDHDVTEEDIQSLLEHIITSENIEWGCKLFDKIDVRFRMRPVWVEECISKIVDRANNDNAKMSMMRFSNMIRVCNTVGSLVSYGGKHFDMRNEDDFNNSYAFVMSLPYPILVKLCDNLAVFDRAVAVAMSDWAVKNFTTRQQATV